MFYVLFFIFTFLVSSFLSYIFSRKKKGFFLDIPGNDFLKIHKAPIPLLGGLAMFLAIAFALIIINKISLDIAGIIIGSLMFFLFGLWDDLKWKHISRRKPYLKLALLIILPLILSFVLVAAGLKINFLPQIIFSYLLTAFYVFVLINSVNYQDGIDGLAAGLVLFSLAGFLILSLCFGNSVGLAVSLVSLGAVLGFFIFNFPPAKIFMGDSGAYFLGFILSILTMIFSKPYNLPAFLGTIFILGLPVFDGVFTNLRRITKKKSIFLGDREHFYDKLILKKKFSTRKTLLICYLIQAIFIIMGLAIYIYGNSSC